MMHDTTIPTLSDLSASRGLWLLGGVRTVLIERARLSRPTLVACTTHVGSQAVVVTRHRPLRLLWGSGWIRGHSGAFLAFLGAQEPRLWHLSQAL